MKNLFRYIGIRHIRLKPLRTFLTFLGVAFGVALYVAISMINDATRKSFRDNIDSVAGKSKLTISAGQAGFAENKLDLIKTIKGVQAAVPMLENRAYSFGTRSAKESLFVLGVDLLQEQAVRSYKMGEEKRVIDDPLLFLNQPDSIILTEAYAARNHLKMDSKLDLATAHGKKTFTVRGLLSPEGAAKAYGGSLAIMDIDGARVMFGKEGKIDRVDILPLENYPVADIKRDLGEKLGPGFVIDEPDAQGDSMEKMVKSYQLMLIFFSSLALLVGLFLIYNSTTVSIAERRREIGVLRALGANQKNILFLFVFEAAVLGFLGSAFGCLLGKGLSYFLVDQVSAAVSNQYATPIRISSLSLNPDQVIFTLWLGTLTAAIAALLPAYRASKVAPTEAMRSRGMETFKSDKAKGWSNLFGFSVYASALLLMRFEVARYWKPLEQVSHGFSVLGAAFFGPVLVFFLIHALKKLLTSKKRTILHLAQENLLRSRSRTSSNIMALMVGLYFVMLVATVRASFHHTVINWVSDVLRADLMITSSGRAITAEVQPLDENIQDEIMKVPGIRQLAPGEGYRSRITRIPFEGVNIALKANDTPPPYSDYRTIAISDGDRISTAKKFYASDEDLVIVSDNFFLKHPNKKVGESLRIETPTGAHDFKIFAKAVDYASPEGVFYLRREIYKKYWNDHLVTAFGVYVDDPKNIEAIRQDLDHKVLSKYGLVTVSSVEVRKMMEDILDQSFAYTRAVEFAALLVALLGLLNTLLISVMERTREIGMMRAIGSTRRQIYQMILIESLIQGGFGAIMATFLGGIVGYFYVTYALAIAMGWIIQFYLPLSSILITIATGIIVSLLAGIIPSRRASNLAIVDALDQE